MTTPSLGRIRAVLLFGAMGDALGYPIEFDKGAALDGHVASGPPDDQQPGVQSE